MSGNANTSINERLECDNLESSEPAAPDGGFGWVVVIASFVVNCIADGISFSIGIIFAEVKMVYEETHGRTAFFGSLFTGIPMFLGPFCAVLIELFDCRIVTVVGGLIAAFGFILSMFATSVEFLCISLGVIGGLGFSMLYVPAIVIVSRYFDSKRALATGICASGSGIGTFAFPLFIEYLLERYHLESTLLLLSGIILNCCVCGILYRPLETYWKTDKLDTAKRKRSLQGSATELAPIMSATDEHASDQRYQVNQSSVDQVLPALHGSLPLLSNPKPVPLSSRSSEDISSNRRWTAGTVDVLIASKTQSNETPWKPSQPSASHHVMIRHMRGHLRTMDRHAVLLHRQWRPGQIPEHVHLHNHRRQEQRPLRYFMSCPELLIDNQSNDVRKLSNGVIGNRSESESSIPSKWYSCFRRFCRRIYSHRTAYLQLLFNKTLWLDWRFILFFFSNVCLYAWYDVPYLYLPSHMEDINLESSSAWIISVLGVVNTVGQVAIGLLGNIPRANIVLLYLVSMILGGLASVIFLQSTGLWGIIAYINVFGFFVSANYSLCSVILVDLFGLERLTTAYGMILFGQGLANSLLPPIGGFLRDYTDSYYLTFGLSGLFMAVSGIILLPIILSGKQRTSTVINVSEPP